MRLSFLHTCYQPVADAIIIGTGLGGLTAGAYLAKQGVKVLLFEQHNWGLRRSPLLPKY